jgi:hypothetical protein
MLKAARTFLVLALAGILHQPAAPAAERVVYLARGLPDGELVTLGAAVAARDGVLLLDSPDTRAATRAFLKAYRPARVVPVGAFADGVGKLEKRLGAPVAAPLKGGCELFARARSAVVCPAKPYRRLLLAACLAGAEAAPLWVTDGRPGESARLRSALAAWGTKRVYLVDEADRVAGVEVIRLTTEAALASAYQHRLLARGPIVTAVACNPADSGRMSALAPWLAVQRRAALLLTRRDGGDAAELVQRAVHQPGLRRLEAVILAADLAAIPTRQRPNPITQDKDRVIEMEPLTPSRGEPFSFAVGRLFHADLAVVPLMLARQRLLDDAPTPRRALVASNPGGSLPLLETFSRLTAHELQNAGYQTTRLFGKDLTAARLRREMPRHDLFLWEGHHNTLIKDWNFPAWDEPMPPAFVFLQSCLALTDHKVQPLFTRGVVGVVGTSTRTYSASGGAISLAFFDAHLHADQTVGASLRQAKNFLLAYALLKERRLGKEAKRGGANHRAAWAFTLWGDPTLRLPRPAAAPRRPGVRYRVAGNTITVELPDETLPEVRKEHFRANVPPNGRAAGLLGKVRDGDERRLVPLVFAEVALPHGPTGQAPRLSGRLPARRWVFVWDARRRCGYLLAVPRASDRHLRFHVEWPAEEVAGTP